MKALAAQKNKIVSFISYKGGVGRSLLLVNIAFALAREGMRIGCIDLDLDAPGLNILFNTGKTPLESHAMASIIASGRILDIDNAIIDIPVKRNGEIFLLPAIDQPEIAEKIMWTKSGTTSTVEKICKKFAANKQLDLILLDARAGAGQSSALALVLAQLIFCIFRIDRQCIEGTKKMKKVLKAHGKSVLYIPSMVPKIQEASIILNNLKHELPFESPIPYSSRMVIDDKVVMRDSPKCQTAMIYSSLANKVLSIL